jgi:alpha-glucoside transport system ATP-binding protein
VTQLHFLAPDGEIAVIAKLPGIRSSLRGQTVRLSADPAKVHLFANGRSLLYR